MNKAFEIALSQYGIKEITGDEDNPEIVKYFNEIGFEWVQDDETAWCSAFANWCCMKADLPRSKKLNARSWLLVGDDTQEPEAGDIVVFWRESKDSWKGHVAFFVNRIDDVIYVLGGNQFNMVCVKGYPANRLLSYRKIG